MGKYIYLFTNIPVPQHWELWFEFVLYAIDCNLFCQILESVYVKYCIFVFKGTMKEECVFLMAKLQYAQGDYRGALDRLQPTQLEQITVDNSSNRRLKIVSEAFAIKGDVSFNSHPLFIWHSNLTQSICVTYLTNRYILYPEPNTILLC